MILLRMPANDGHVKVSYYRAYYEATAAWARAAGWKVVWQDRSDLIWCGGDVNAYSCALADTPDQLGTQFIMDFSDFKPFQLDAKKMQCPYFKWRLSYDVAEHMEHRNVFPAALTLRFDFAVYDDIRTRFPYTASGNLILNNQVPRAAAKDRRLRAQQLLRVRYGEQVRTDILEPAEWWALHQHAALAVSVPGARIDILDKGMMEQMGLGVCVLTPPIRTILPGYRCLQPWIHYVPLRPDFSDLIAKVDYCLHHRARCRRIGDAARELFDGTMTPVAYWGWVKKCVGGYHG